MRTHPARRGHHLGIAAPIAVGLSASPSVTSWSVLGALLVIGLAMLAGAVLRIFSEEFARRSRPHAYVATRRDQPEREDDTGLNDVLLVVVLLAVIIGGAMIMGVGF